ncbi:MAG: hypothetical protein MI919_14235 [Holophagales bacterium]|nr:hypothetical protein [Holophagales bacterium]
MKLNTMSRPMQLALGGLLVVLMFVAGVIAVPEPVVADPCGGFPPCGYEWECRGTDCGGYGVAWRRMCWASPYYCGPWEPTPICC